MIRFLHAGELIELDQVPADTTVLEYLREHRALTGTKEGCASGDCGACTVVTAEPDRSPDADEPASGLRYTPLNACIAPLGAVHGKQLITVEELQQGDDLHPVQQAMVDCHGSQCGFCTPGFVMSLFALYHVAPRTSDEDPVHDSIVEALGGNLCRCTGYRPILAAAEQALDARRDDQFDREEADTLLQLSALDTQASVSKTNYHLPRSASEVAELRATHPDAPLVAGGTDLLLEVTQKLKQFPVMIDLRHAADLHAIAVTPEHISLGAAVTHRDCLPGVLGDYPELAELIERFGSLQIRSAGTVAGNIANASPIGDWPPVLLALEGELTLMSSRGERTVSGDAFFLDYRRTALQDDEFVRNVNLPRRVHDLFLRAYKISKRYEDDISSVCLVIALRLEGDRIAAARIGCGGMAAIPKRALRCEQALCNLNLREDSLHDAISAMEADFTPIDDARASAAYRQRVAGNLLLRLQAEYRDDGPTRAHTHSVEALRG